MTGKPLTPKQQRFVAEYAIDLNATQAAIRAGYSPKTAYAIGAENLKKPQITTALSPALAAPLERAEWDVTRIVQRAGEIALQDKPDRVAALALLAKRHPEFSDKLDARVLHGIVELPPGTTLADIDARIADLKAAQ